jgi:hypothetical protein
MGPQSDAGEQSWWEDVLAAANLDHPDEPPELLSTHLERAANGEELEGLERLWCKCGTSYRAVKIACRH